MCLIVHKPASAVIHESWLRDFYKKNNDGFGIMYSEEGKLHIHKSLGNADRFVAAFKAREDKAMLIHLRMRTHGKIDLDNCHPYEVLPSESGGELGAVWMMHNGVLSYGNDGNRDKSDTWHYIKSFLRPILTKCPTLLLDEAFQKLVMREMGYGNKFAFMTSRGDVVIMNSGAGVMWNDVWLSNTYAWSASDAKIPGATTSYSGGGYYHYDRGDDGWKSGMTWRDGKWRWPEGDKRGEVSTDHGDAVPADPLDNAAVVDTPAVSPPTTDEQPPVQTAWPWAASPENAGRGILFALLTQGKFDDAYNQLSVVEVQAAFDNDLDGMQELLDEIRKGSFKAKIDDEFIIKWVQRLAVKHERSTT